MPDPGLDQIEKNKIQRTKGNLSRVDWQVLISASDWNA